MPFLERSNCGFFLEKKSDHLGAGQPPHGKNEGPAPGQPRAVRAPKCIKYPLVEIDTLHPQQRIFPPTRMARAPSILEGGGGGPSHPSRRWRGPEPSFKEVEGARAFLQGGGGGPSHPSTEVVPSNTVRPAQGGESRASPCIPVHPRGSLCMAPRGDPAKPGDTQTKSTLLHRVLARVGVNTQEPVKECIREARRSGQLHWCGSIVRPLRRLALHVSDILDNKVVASSVGGMH
eukprot:gene14989-biopygen3636